MKFNLRKDHRGPQRYSPFRSPQMVLRFSPGFPEWRRSCIFACLCSLVLMQGCRSSTDPNQNIQAGLTAKEAEQLAIDRALTILGNPTLISILAPEAGGGLTREGRLAKGARGKWWFTYIEPGDFRALVVETEGSFVRADFVSLDNFPSLQEIPLDYVDSSEALIQAEVNGGKDLAEVEIIICNLIGEPIWPKNVPRKVAWFITYKLNDGNLVVYYVDAVTGVYLGKG